MKDGVHTYNVEPIYAYMVYSIVSQSHTCLGTAYICVHWFALSVGIAC